MPRWKELPGETRIVAVNLLQSQVNVLKQIARAKGASLSHVAREAIELYVREEAARLGIQLASNLSQNPEQPLQAIPFSVQMDGGGEIAQPVAEPASERRWRLVTKLDEPMVEGLVKDTEKLDRIVADLERVPVSMRLTESFLSRRKYARKKLVDLKKVARYLIRAGVEVPEETVDKLVAIERRLNNLE